jgi:hypothetical protein
MIQVHVKLLASFLNLLQSNISLFIDLFSMIIISLLVSKASTVSQKIFWASFVKCGLIVG